MRATLFVILFICLFGVQSAAETVDISSDLRLHFEIPAGWVSNPEPPQFLLDEMAEHIEHDAEEKGQHPTEEQLQRAARKRFADNEALLYNPKTHSFMSLDFSHLRQGEKPPSHKSIKLSARYAGESLSNEEGVTEAKTETANIEIRGAWYAQRFDSSYKHHERPMAFIGVVGFVSPYWFYLYYTDYLSDDQDRVAAESILQSILIESR